MATYLACSHRVVVLLLATVCMTACGCETTPLPQDASQSKSTEAGSEDDTSSDIQLMASEGDLPGVSAEWQQRFPESTSPVRALRTIDEQLQEQLTALQSDYVDVRIAAIQTFGNWKLEKNSERAADVFQILLAQRRKEFNDYEAPYIDAALRQMGDVAVAEILRLAASEEIANLSNACEAMRSLGEPFYPQLRETLHGMLQSGSSTRNWGGMYVLEKMGPSSRDSLPLVKKFLTDADFQNQIIALRYLAALGSSASSEWEQVHELTKSGQNISVISHALRTLGYISAGDAELGNRAAEAIAEHLGDFAFMSKARALEGLIALGQNAGPAQEKAKALMRDHTGLAPQAAVVYGQTSGEWEPSFKLLESQVKDLTVGFEVLKLLEQLGPQARPTAAVLIELTKDEDGDVALAGAQALVAQVTPAEIKIGDTVSPEDQEHLQVVAKALEELASRGEAEPHHFARTILSRWKELGWFSAQ